MKFIRVTHFNRVKKSHFLKTKMADGRCPDMLRSIYFKRLSNVQNWFGVNADGGAYWHNLANTIELSICGGNVAFCQI